LREQPYDLVLDLQGLTKSVMWGLQAHGPLVGYDRHSIRDPFASLFYRRKTAVSWQLQAVERNRRLAAAHLGYPMPDSPPDFGLRAPAAAWMPPRDYAVLVPCASRPEKLWPEDRWVAVGRHCLERGWQPVLLWGSPAEEALARRIAARCDGLVPPFLTVGETAAVLAASQHLVGLDTGFTHLGAAFGRPTVGIYCDHEPGQAGVTGSGSVTSLGGKGQVPALDAVLAAFEAQRTR
jgi:heptosyltransferase-1